MKFGNNGPCSSEMSFENDDGQMDRETDNN